MIRRCGEADTERILDIINDAAEAYRGQIPEDCFHDPYMGAGELAAEIAAGIEFRGWEEAGRLVAVMGLQAVCDVTLIRHAYVVTALRRRGIGSRLLRRLLAESETPLLIGTWRAATWAIEFYLKHGFEVASRAETRDLLKRYWTVPDRQIESSVVLAAGGWLALNRGEAR